MAGRLEARKIGKACMSVKEEASIFSLSCLLTSTFPLGSLCALMSLR